MVGLIEGERWLGEVVCVYDGHEHSMARRCRRFFFTFYSFLSGE